MSTSNMKPLTPVHLSEEFLIGASTLVVLLLTLPVLLSSTLQVALLTVGCIFATSSLIVISRVKGYTKRTQSRVGLGGSLLTFAATSVAFATSPIAGGVFFITATIGILIQLAFKF